MLAEPMQDGDLMPFLRAHDCFRRDLTRLENLLADVRPLDEERTQALVDYWAGVVELLEHHHRTEDDNMLPALLDRMPSAARVIDELEQEHVVLQRLLDEAAPLVSGLTGSRSDRAAAARCVAEVRRVVAAHLDAEERTVVPLFGQCLSRSEWLEIESRTTEALIRDGLLPFALPWAAEGLDPAVMEAALEPLPAATREAYHTEWQGRHTERVRLIWGDPPTATGPGAAGE